MSEGRPLQIFLRYASADASACNALIRHLAVLQRNGQVESWHEGCIKPGRNRQQELIARMEAAELILLLVSADFLASEFCYEVHLEQALTRHRAGDAVVVPIIVRPVDWTHAPFGNLPGLPAGNQAISSFPDPEAAWHQVSNVLRQIVEQRRRPSIPKPALPPLPEPPGGGYFQRSYIRRPLQEQDALAHLLTPGTPAVLFAPELFGKTLTMHHLIAELSATARPTGSAADAAETLIIAIDLRQFDPTVWASLDSFLMELGAKLLAGVGAPANGLAAAWQGKLSPTLKLSRLLETEILPRVSPSGRLVVAIDHTDIVCERTAPKSAIPDSFFGLLRVWIDRSRTCVGSVWQRLRLLLAIATSPAYLTRNLNQSPFNVCLPVELPDLDPNQIAAMANTYGFSGDKDGIAELQNQVKGHPYLIRLALYRSVMAARSLRDLLHEHQNGSLFDDFLLRIRSRLQRAGLYDAAARISQKPQAPIPPNTYHLLQRAGIIMRQSDLAGCSYSLRYPIYARMFHL